jgi:hypothetical protein
MEMQQQFLQNTTSSPEAGIIVTDGATKAVWDETTASQQWKLTRR